MRIVNTLIISDTQIPYHHPDTVSFLKAVARHINCREVYHIGDEIDANTLSRYAKNPDLPGCADEWRASKKVLKELHKLWPKMRLCYSNHTGRVFKRLYDAGIPGAWLKSLQEIYELPGWAWAPRWEIQTAYGPAWLVHGQKKKGAINRAKQTGTSHIHGHHHSLFGLQYLRTEGKILFGMDLGCLVDEHSAAFEYGENAQYDQILGCGAIVDGYPRLFPMITNGSGRWNRRIV